MLLRRSDWLILLKEPWVWINALSLVGLCYCASVGVWHRIGLILLLFFLMAVIEFFPIHIGQTSFTLSLPLIYTIFAVTGFASATVGAAVTVFITLLIRRDAWSHILYQVSKWTWGILLAWGIDSVVTVGGHSSNHILSLLYWDLHLVISSAAITVTCCTLAYLYEKQDGSVVSARTWLFIPSIIFGLTVLYDMFMLWLASNPKNTQSGNLGTLFFFLPLVTLNLVVYLIVNLIRTKRGLEKIVDLSEKMNQFEATVPAVLQQIIDAASRLIDNDGCALCQLDGGSRFMLQETVNHEIQSTLTVPQEAVDLVLAQRETVLVKDPWKNTVQMRSQNRHARMKSLVLSPILSDGNVAGILVVGRQNARAFRTYEKRILTIFSAQAGVAMKNALYLEEREKRLLVEERNRLAREIHDGIAQDLAGVLLQVEALKRVELGESRAALAGIQAALTRTAATVRSSIFALRPEPYVQRGLIPAIRDHIGSITAGSNIDIRFQVDEPAFPELPIHIAKTIYSTLIECVQNTVKHANASSLNIALEPLSEAVRLIVQDDGSGFHFGRTVIEAGRKQSFGLGNLYHMAGEIHASLEFDTALGQGTTVILDVPVKGDVDHEEASGFAL